MSAPAIRRSRARRAQRGATEISNMLEACVILIFTVVVILGGLAVDRSSRARRSAETAAEQGAVQSSAQYCRPVSVTIGTASAQISILTNGLPNGVSAAIAMIQALGGVGGGRTWAYYIMPLLNAYTGSATNGEPIEVPFTDANPANRTFFAQRNSGCLERPLDIPSGTMNFYRNVFWLKNLFGY